MSVVPEGIFEFHEDIRSAMVIDRIGNVIALASRTRKPVDQGFVKDVTSKHIAMMGGILRGSETAYGALKWVHFRYNKLHAYGWLVGEGYLVFTSRSQLEDSLLDAIGTSPVARARYADQWRLDGRKKSGAGSG